MTAIIERDEDCRACYGTGCRLGPDGCNGRAHLFIGCSTCIACRGSGLAPQNGACSVTAINAQDGEAISAIEGEIR